MIMNKTKNWRWQDMDKESIELADLCRHYELFNKTEGKSSRTIEWYNLALKQFSLFLSKYEKSSSISGLTETTVREFILYLQEKDRWEDNPYVNGKGKLAAITIQSYIRALRAFFSWLYREEYTNTNRLAKLRPPKAPRKIVNILTSAEMNKVVNCSNTNTAAGARNYAMLMLLFDSGLRSSELRSFNVNDINIEGGYLKVMGKGSKERVVPFGVTAQKALLRYLLHFRPEPFNPIIENFFLTLDGKPVSGDSIKMIFQRILKKTGIARFYPHLCRHTFATNYLINGGDVFSLQQILGHSTLEMVRHYVTLASAQVTIQHRKFSPMDRMSLGSSKILQPARRTNNNIAGINMNLRPVNLR